MLGVITNDQPLEIRLHDHLIVGDPAVDKHGLGYYSFKRGGHL
jgi:hypothetical protein